jgi:hypothetical protein
MGRMAIGLVELVVLRTVLMTAPCLAHDAPSGWPYPAECCDARDCYEISSDEVELRRDGSYRIRQTGEIFLSPGRGYEWDRSFRWSLDLNFHRCSRKGQRSYLTYCLFVPPPPM